MKTKYSIALRIFSLALILSLIAPSFASAALYRQLQVGMSGADVRELQSFLASDPSVYPQGLVTGYFGSLTRAAVMRFQAKFGISTVGRVGPQTMAAINAQMSGNVFGGTGGDDTAPILSTRSVTTTNSSATFAWTTNENASAIIYYSTSPLVLTEASAGSAVNISGNTSVANLVLSTGHSVTLPNLQSNTTYYYSIYVRDANGNSTVTWPTTFRTQ